MTIFKKISELSLRLDRRISTSLLKHSENEQSLGSRILVVGFFGAFNLGDELILETTLNYLKKTHGDASITIMLSDNYSSDITRYGDYRFIHYPHSPLELNELALHYDSVVFPGGAIIDDVNYGLEQKPLSIGTTLVNLSLRFITMHKPCIIYGLSSNKHLSNQEFINKLQSVVDGATSFSLRDTYSLETLSKAGINTAGIEIVDDIVIANEAILAKPKVQKNTVGLIYVFNESTIEALTLFTKKLLDTLPQKSKLEIIPFYDFNKNDVVYAQKLIQSINDSRLSLQPGQIGNFQQTVDRIGKKSVIISMRYHGTLLANLLGIKTLCIDLDTHPHYFNKNKYLFDHYGFPKNVIPFTSLSKVSSKTISDFIKKSPKRGKIEEIHTSAVKRLLKILKGSK